MTNTEQLLIERGKTHGEYKDHASCTQRIKDLMRAEKNWDRLSPCAKESLEMFAHKIGRILTGNPDIHDHWDDIAGYAKLVSQRIPTIDGVREALGIPTPENLAAFLNKRKDEVNPMVPRREVEDNALHGLKDGSCYPTDGQY